MYKYIDRVSALPFLLNGSLKFTPVSDLNDPAELVPRVDLTDLERSLHQLRSSGYREEDIPDLRRQGILLRRYAPRYHVIDAPPSAEVATRIIQSHFYGQLPLLLELLNRAAAEIASKVGVFCVSSRSDCAPMWAHYAANGKGLAVEFSGLQEIFPGDETGIIRKLVPVRYDRDRCGITFDPRSHETMFVAKVADWQYEQEWRVVMPLNDCEAAEAHGKPIFFFKIPTEHVRRVIVGWDMPEDDVRDVQAAVAATDPRVLVERAVFERGAIRTLPLAAAP